MKRPTFSLATRRAWLLAAASTAVLAACGGSDDDSFDDRADLADPKLRFVHAVPGGPNVTLQRNAVNEPDATNVPYKFGSQYYDVGTAVYAFSLRTATGNVQVATTSLETHRGDKVTLLAVPSASSGVDLLTIVDPFNKSVASDDARVRVFNASANAQTFDVYITAPATNLATVSPNVAGLGYKQAAPASEADSIDIEGGTYLLRITPTGSKTPFFTATIAVPANGDWLLVTLPDDAAPLNPNNIRVLLVRADDSADATDELITQ